SSSWNAGWSLSLLFQRQNVVPLKLVEPLFAQAFLQNILGLLRVIPQRLLHRGPIHFLTLLLDRLGALLVIADAALIRLDRAVEIVDVPVAEAPRRTKPFHRAIT